MRHALSILCLVLMLGIAFPAQAQLRRDVHSQSAPARLYDQGGFSLNKFFDPAHFRMSHSLEFTAGSFGGQSSSLAMYTNTMMFQFSSKLAGRVDMALAYSPTGNVGSVTGSNQGRLFLRNAELAYRPTKNMQLHLSVRQSPYGYYASPYGYGGYGGYSPYGGRYSSFQAGFGADDRDLFWNDRLR